MNGVSPVRRESALRVWAEMIKFSHSVFALPFALIATFLAGRHLPGGHPTLLHLILIVVCMVAISALSTSLQGVFTGVAGELDAVAPSSGA